MIRYALVILGLFSFTAWTEESGAPMEPRIVVELGAGQAKILAAEGINLPAAILSRLETDLMVDNRLAPIVTGVEIQRINLDPSAVKELVDQWQDHYADTAEQIHDQVVLQATGETTDRGNQEISDESDAKLDEAVHRALTPLLRLKSAWEERWNQWGTDGVMDHWFSGWAVVALAFFGWLFSWFVMAATEALLPGFFSEAKFLWRQNPLLNFGLGAAGTVAFLPGLVFLVVTLVGIVLLPFYFAAAILFLILAYPTAIAMVGGHISKSQSMVWTVAAGQAVFLVLSFIPFVGAAVKSCLGLMALGLSLRLIYRRIF